MLMYYVNNPKSKKAKQIIGSELQSVQEVATLQQKGKVNSWASELLASPSVTCTTVQCDRYTPSVKFQASIFKLTSSFAPHLTYRILVNIETHRWSLQLAFLSTKGVPKKKPKLTIDSNAKANLNKAFKRCGKSIELYENRCTCSNCVIT